MKQGLALWRAAAEGMVTACRNIWKTAVAAYRQDKKAEAGRGKSRRNGEGRLQPSEVTERRAAELKLHKQRLMFAPEGTDKPKAQWTEEEIMKWGRRHAAELARRQAVIKAQLLERGGGASRRGQNGGGKVNSGKVRAKEGGRKARPRRSKTQGQVWCGGATVRAVEAGTLGTQDQREEMVRTEEREPAEEVAQQEEQEGYVMEAFEMGALADTAERAAGGTGAELELDEESGRERLGGYEEQKGVG